MTHTHSRPDPCGYLTFIRADQPISSDDIPFLYTARETLDRNSDATRLCAHRDGYRRLNLIWHGFCVQVSDWMKILFEAEWMETRVCVCARHHLTRPWLNPTDFKIATQEAHGRIEEGGGRLEFVYCRCARIFTLVIPPIYHHIQRQARCFISTAKLYKDDQVCVWLRKLHLKMRSQ